MVTLINIIRNNDTISADYIPEDTDQIGSIKIRISDEKVIERKLTKSDEIFACYFQHAKKCLCRLKNKVELPKKETIMWY